MPLKIERNDITKMNTEAIVNTAGSTLEVGDGCDVAIYMAAGYDELHDYRVKNIGCVPEGEAFITPGFKLSAKYIIHAVSPLYIDGESGEEEKLRACYRNSLKLAIDNGIKSIAFPLISTGAYGYPMADGLQIALDEINGFLLKHDLDVVIVVFGTKAALLAEKVYPRLQAYIDHNYVCEKREEEYGDADRRFLRRATFHGLQSISGKSVQRNTLECMSVCDDSSEEDIDTSKLKERLKHISDPFGTYVMYLTESKGLTSVDVQNRAWITKGLWFKIKSNPDNYKPEKLTAFKLCIGLGLNLDESKDLLARAGIMFSPSSKEDLIWQFCIENGMDVYDTSDTLEEFGYSPIISI